MKNIFTSVLVLFVFLNLSAQNKVDLRLQQVSVNADQSCFDIELSSPHKVDIKLAGQNFRIFYDSKRTKLIESSIRTYISDQSYSAPDVINTADNGIGFFSLSLDARVNDQSTIILPIDGSWKKVANACFANQGSDRYDLVWANDRTNQFASAQVALSEWVDEQKQAVLSPNMMIDYLGKDMADNIMSMEVKVYPNPLVDHIKVDIEGDYGQDVSLLITDVIGREVVYQSIDGSSNLYYDMSNWPSGRYKVELLDIEGRILHSENVVKAMVQN